VRAVAGRRCGTQGAASSTLAELSCQGDSHVSVPLLRRLAQIIRAARKDGPTEVVLASNWRKPKFCSRVEGLEREISKVLGEHFAFDARTRKGEEKTAGKRLECIGDFFADRCSVAKVGAFRAVVLDDFFVTPLNGWACDSGLNVSSEADAEAYLKSRVSSDVDAAALVLHPYQEWETSSGLLVQIGSGLSQEHVKQALDFLGGDAVPHLMSLRTPPTPARNAAAGAQAAAQARAEAVPDSQEPEQRAVALPRSGLVDDKLVEGSDGARLQEATGIVLAKATRQYEMMLDFIDSVIDESTAGSYFSTELCVAWPLLSMHL